MTTKLKAIDATTQKLDEYKAHMINANEHKDKLHGDADVDFILNVLGLVFKEKRVVPDTPHIEMAKKVTDANFNPEQKEVLIGCLSLAHMRGVRFGCDPRCGENMAYVFKEIGLYP